MWCRWRCTLWEKMPRLMSNTPSRSDSAQWRGSCLRGLSRIVIEGDVAVIAENVVDHVELCLRCGMQKVLCEQLEYLSRTRFAARGTTACPADLHACPSLSCYRTL